MWESKGYAMDEKMDIQEYTQWHMAYTLRGQGDPNIARTIARESLSYTATAARTLAKKAKKLNKELSEDYEETNDIYSMQARKIREKERIIEKYSNWRNIVEAKDREAVFKEMAAAEIDIDMWNLPDEARDKLYHHDLKRFRERFEADLYSARK